MVLVELQHVVAVPMVPAFAFVQVPMEKALLGSSFVPGALLGVDTVVEQEKLVDHLKSLAFVLVVQQVEKMD